jgi:hypothetical protein
MSGPFDLALGTLFSGPGAAVALYQRRRGEAIPSLAVIIREKGEDLVVADAAFPATARIALVQVVDLDEAGKGDTLTIERATGPADTYTVAKARKDTRGFLWRLELE